MEKSFWLERWELEETGFHQRAVNEDLRAFWSEVDPLGGEPVFVPLCGKSGDMLWLANQGHPVIGVELSRMAVESFFVENGISFEWKRHRTFDAAVGGGLRILCGDVFDLTGEDLGPVRLAYDRAALVAFPPAMRERYVAHLKNVLQPAARILLVSIEYPENEMDGPPFSVTRAEIGRLYGGAEIHPLSRRNILPDSPRFSDRGVTSMESCAYLIEL